MIAAETEHCYFLSHSCGGAAEPHERVDDVSGPRTNWGRQRSLATVSAHPTFPQFCRFTIPLFWVKICSNGANFDFDAV
jgi:hypothetical protein